MKAPETQSFTALPPEDQFLGLWVVSKLSDMLSGDSSGSSAGGAAYQAFSDRRVL